MTSEKGTVTLTLIRSERGNGRSAGPERPSGCPPRVTVRGMAFVRTESAAGGWPSWSPPEESLAKREHIYGGRAQAAVWDHLVRQLET